jgi:hypothetical protein
MGKTNSDDFQTIVYVIAALATIATFIFTFGPALARRIEERRASESPEPSVDVSQPADGLESPPTSTDVDYKISEMTHKVSELGNAINTSDASTEVSVDKKPAADIKLDCGKASIVNGSWYWDCYLRNNSDKMIWWKDSFQNEGSQLRWHCLEPDAQTCKASTFLKNEIILSEDHSIQFHYLNPHESINFWISCPQEPLSCGVHGRAPGLIIEEASFSRYSK